MADRGRRHQRPHEDEPDELVATAPVGAVDDEPGDDDVDEVVADGVELGAEPVAGPGPPGDGAVEEVAAEVADEDGVAGPVELPGDDVVDRHHAAQQVHEREHVLQPEVPHPGRRHPQTLTLPGPRRAEPAIISGPSSPGRHLRAVISGIQDRRW